MSLNQWKLLNQVRDTLTKLYNDKSWQSISTRDILHMVQRVPDESRGDLKYPEPPGESEPVSRVKQATQTVASAFSKIKKDQKDKPIVQVPKWRRKSSSISECSIVSQTHHTVLAIQSAENVELLEERIEALLNHVKQYPEGKNGAIRAGALRLLLNIRSNFPKGHQIQDPVRESLALLGYSDPVPGQGIRILSMDGGGIRGLLVLEMLKKLEELTGRKVHEMFDLFCGVSTGAILSFSIGIHHTNLDEIAKGYKDISMEVFNKSAIWGTGSLVWSHAYYDTSLWEQKLREHLGSNSLISTARDPQCPKLCAVSTVVNQSSLSGYVFRNYSLPWRVKSHYFGSSQHEVWQAARASAAAPTYFEEYKLGNFLHQDGGILVNNPTAVALHEAKLIWPGTPIQCVVSFGTGRSVPSPSDLVSDPRDSSNSTSWANKFYKILDSATDTEGVHIMLNDLLPDHVYYRFNPYLTEMVSMVEIRPEKIEQLQRDALMYLRRNEDKFQEAAKALMQEKSKLQKAKDYVNLKRDMYGL